jgi:hypothetical protein
MVKHLKKNLILVKTLPGLKAEIQVLVSVFGHPT